MGPAKRFKYMDGTGIYIYIYNIYIYNMASYTTIIYSKGPIVLAGPPYILKQQAQLAVGLG